MANPINEQGLLSDKNGNPIISTQQALVADPSALTSTAIAAAVPSAVATTAVTQTTPYGYASAAQGDAVATTINSLITHAAELDLDYEALLVDVTSIRTQLVAILNVLEAHGLMADA